jgi:hypothetical protein
LSNPEFIFGFEAASNPAGFETHPGICNDTMSLLLFFIFIFIIILIPLKSLKAKPYVGLLLHDDVKRGNYRRCALSNIVCLLRRLEFK